MAGAYPRPQFSVDERVFMVLKNIETGNFWKQSEGLKSSFRIRGHLQTDKP